MLVTNEEKMVVLTDSASNIIFVDVEEVKNPEIVQTYKVAGLGKLGSLHTDQKDSPLLVGASEGKNFLVYDIHEQKEVTRV